MGGGLYRGVGMSIKVYVQEQVVLQGASTLIVAREKDHAQSIIKQA